MKICSLDDLLNVPEDRLACCLAELAAALDPLRSARIIAELAGSPPPVFTGFEWMDDGDDGATIHFSTMPDAVRP